MSEYRIVGVAPIGVTGVATQGNYPVVALLSLVFEGPDTSDEVAVYAGVLLPSGQVVPVLGTNPSDEINVETYPTPNRNPVG